MTLPLVGTASLQTLPSAPSHCMSKPSSGVWDLSDSSRNRAGRWLAASRHCLGAAFDQEQRACEVLFSICLLKC